MRGNRNENDQGEAEQIGYRQLIEHLQVRFPDECRDRRLCTRPHHVTCGTSASALGASGRSPGSCDASLPMCDSRTLCARHRPRAQIAGLIKGTRQKMATLAGAHKRPPMKQTGAELCHIANMDEVWAFPCWPSRPRPTVHPPCAEVGLRPFTNDINTLHWEGARRVEIKGRGEPKMCLSAPVVWFGTGEMELVVVTRVTS